MTRLTLTLRDLTHGGSLDADGIILLACILFACACLLFIAFTGWRQDRDYRRAMGEDDR